MSAVVPGVPAAGHVTSRGWWHPGRADGCPKCDDYGDWPPPEPGDVVPIGGYSCFPDDDPRVTTTAAAAAEWSRAVVDLARPTLVEVVTAALNDAVSQVQAELGFTGFTLVTELDPPRLVLRVAGGPTVTFTPLWTGRSFDVVIDGLPVDPPP